MLCRECGGRARRASTRPLLRVASIFLPWRDTDMASVKQDLDEANKLFALKKYDSASDLIASALEAL